VLLDLRTWLFIGLCIAMLYTVELIQRSVRGARSPVHGRAGETPAVRETRALWVILSIMLLPGLLLTFMNMAISVAQGLPYAPEQISGMLFVLVGWLLALIMMTNVAGLSRFLESAGAVPPLMLIAILGLGDLLLLVSLIETLPAEMISLFP
jgi:hypothetical protein